MKPFVIAQFSDCHLKAGKNEQHYGALVYSQLVAVLVQIAQFDDIDLLVFTGDLTQDHSELSYQNFVDAIAQANITKPVYYLAGNHDEPELLNRYLIEQPFVADKLINSEHWQIHLFHSKSATPAGLVAEHQWQLFEQYQHSDKHQLIMQHHHPMPVGYFIDRHGLQQAEHYWQQVAKYNNIKAIACGHVHGAYQFVEPTTQVQVLTCPATSIQFDPDFDGIKPLALAAGFRLLQLFPNGTIKTQVIRI